jgi:hypothetical protein
VVRSTGENLRANGSVDTNWSGNTTPKLPTAVQTSNLQVLTTVPTLRSNGICEVYKGGPLCEHWLRNRTVFVDPRFTQEDMRQVVEQLFSSVPFTNETRFLSECNAIFNETICKYLFPNCTVGENGEIHRARVCFESCHKLKFCSNSFYHILSIKAKKFPDLWDNFNPLHLKLSDISCPRDLLPTANSRPGLSCLVLVEDLEWELVSTCDGNANGSYCSFPFFYNGVGYDECTVVNSFDSWRPWCVTEQKGSDETSKWGYCDCEVNNTVSLKATCDYYSGGLVCKKYLDGKIVFSGNVYNQRDLGILMDHFNKSFYSSQQNSGCIEPSLQILCHLLFPECHKNTSLHGITPRLLCYESCTAVSNGSCGSEFIQMMQEVTSYFQLNSLNPVHFYAGQPLCSQLPPKAKFLQNCADINIDVSSPGSSSSHNKVAISISVGCIILIALCIVMIWKRRKTEEIISPEQCKMYFANGVPVETEQVETEIEWDADIACVIPKTLVNGKRIKLAEQIGEGNFGRVFKGTLDADKIVAVKSLKSVMQEGIDWETANTFVREALRMKHLDHPHVMKLIGICWATEVMFLRDDLSQMVLGPLIVLPYTELGDLRGYLRAKRSRASSIRGNSYFICSNVREWLCPEI